MESKNTYTTFILNPRSGTMGGKRSAIRLIDRIWGGASRRYKILVTTRAGEGIRLAEEEANLGSDLIVAVGGDGTLNEVVHGVLGKDTCVGLIPSGSGNGFARHWKIPLNYEKACRGLLHPRVAYCDAGMADDHLFLVTFGCGLDADISDRYSHSKFRGVGSYVYHSIRAYFNYQSRWVVVRSEESTVFSGKPLLLTLAITRGYGGGMVIAPQAKADDGLLDLCILAPLSLKTSIKHIPDLFNGKISRIPGYQHHRLPGAVLERAENGPIHVDGEPLKGNREIRISILKQAVKLALPA